MLVRRTAILAIREATYGTDPAMTGTNGLLAYDVDIDISGEQLERAVLRDTLTPMPHVVGMRQIKLSFKTELKGTNGTPEIDPLLHGCAFASGAASGTLRPYAPISIETSIGSTSFKFYKDGNLHKVTGARGTFKLNATAGKYGEFEWEFQGIYNAVGADTLPDISGLTANKPPICYAAGLKFDTYSPICSKLELDLGNEIARREDLNAASGVQGFRITGRKGSFKATVDATTEATFPWWTDYMGSVVRTFYMEIGSVAGNKIQIGGKFQQAKLKYGDQDGISTYEIEGALCSSDSDSQNDEMFINFV